MIQRWFTGLLLLPLFSGCSTFEQTKERLHEHVHDDDAPTFPMADAPRYSLEGGTAPPQNGWWRAFGKDDLNRWVERALHGNRDAVAALKRLEQAEAFLRQQASPLFPSLDVRGGFDEVWRDGNPNNNGSDEEFTAGIALSYDLDLWEKNRAGRASAEALADASREELANIAIQVSRRATELWLTLEENREVLKLLQAQVGINRDLLEILRDRQAIGQAGRVAILQQEQQLASVDAEIPDVVAAIQAAGNHLRLLSNQMPNALVPVASVGGLPNLPAAPALGSPIDLLENRPDLRASWDRVRAAERDTVVAAAARLPLFSTDFSYNFAARDISEFEDNQTARLGIGVTAPILDGGRRRAIEDRQRALAEERVIQFGTAFLDAVNEVEDAVRREEFQLELIKRLRRQAQLASDVAGEARDQYTNGVGPFVTVFNAQSSEQASRRRVVRERAKLLRIRAGLYEALGGEWTKQLVPLKKKQDKPRTLLGVPVAPAAKPAHAPGHVH